MNAYLTALDLHTNQILWRSQSLVCSYGFTAKPDYLYLINKNTGEILQQIQIKTAPDYIIRQNNKIYVHTYDTDYIFSSQRLSVSF